MLVARDWLARCVGQPDVWPADGAGVGLCVEPAVGRVLILLPAVVAERENPHRRVGTVVRDVGDDREARPAVGAVDERVAIPAVGWIEKLPHAVGARRYVGRDKLVAALLLLGVPDLELREAVGRDGA